MNDLFLYLAGGALVVIGLCLGSYLNSRGSKSLLQHLQLKNQGLSEQKSYLGMEVISLRKVIEELANADPKESKLKKIISDTDKNIKRDQELATMKHPTEEDVKKRRKETGESYYDARERLREIAYGGKPPYGFSSWGDYWKHY